MAEYSKRNPVELDDAGGHYSRHVAAMTAEGLHDKSDIAAELAWRDMRIGQLLREIGGYRKLRSRIETVRLELRDLLTVGWPGPGDKGCAGCQKVWRHHAANERGTVCRAHNYGPSGSGSLCPPGPEVVHACE